VNGQGSSKGGKGYPGPTRGDYLWDRADTTTHKMTGTVLVQYWCSQDSARHMTTFEIEQTPLHTKWLVQYWCGQDSARRMTTFEIEQDVLRCVPVKWLVVRKHILVWRLHSPLQFINPSNTPGLHLSSVLTTTVTCTCSDFLSSRTFYLTFSLQPHKINPKRLTTSSLETKRAGLFLHK